MARLGALIASYRLAAQTYSELVGLGVSAATLEEVSTLAGKQLRDVERGESLALSVSEEASLAKGGKELKGADHLCISMDGAKVNTHEGWREVKVVAVSEVEELEHPQGDGTRVRLVNHSYRAGLWDAKEFGEEQWKEARRRGVEVAKRVTSVNDGAPWIWGLVELCYPTALQVIDWWHVVDRMWEVAKLVYGQGTEGAVSWVAARKEELWDGRVMDVTMALKRLKPGSDEARQEVRLLREYVLTHAERMRCRDFRESGVPVGSGTVESACKNVVGSRMKRGGMRWKAERAGAVLALRCALLSNRWAEAWDKQRLAA